MVSPQIYKTAFQNILFSEDTKEAGRHSEQGTDVGSELLGFSLLTRSGVQLQTEKKSQLLSLCGKMWFCYNLEIFLTTDVKIEVHIGT